MQSGATRDRSFFCKCVSRLDARQVPWHRQGPEEVILESQVLAAVESSESHVFIVLMIVSWFLWSSHLLQSLTSLMSITNFFFIWWVCGEPWEVLYGSIMHMLVHTIMPLDDPEQNLINLWANVKRLYKELNIAYKFSSLKMTMFTTKGGNSDS